VQTLVRERLRQRGLVLIAALLLVAGGGPFAGILGGRGPTACDLLSEPTLQRLFHIPSDKEVRGVPGYWLPQGTTLCSSVDGSWYGSGIEVAARDARVLYESTKAGRPRQTSWRAPTNADRLASIPPDLFDGPPPPSAWEPLIVTSLGFEAFTADGDLFLLKSGLYVRVSLGGLRIESETGSSPTTDRTAAAIALVVASHIPPRFVWWNPINWLDNALP
jgi:hypothetical protein